MSDVFRLEHLTKTFGRAEKETTALDDVSLTIPAGSFFGIVGASGAGKSTLLRLLNRLETPDAGRILFHDDDIGAFSKSREREYLSRVPTIFQHFNLFHGKTVLENIAFPLAVRGVARSARRERARELIELIGLSGKEKAYPSELSGGQKQRVGIARALVADAEVLLCDEATSALDSETTAVILDLLLELRDRLQLTIVLITHAWSVVRHACDSATLIDGGRIVESGAVGDLLRDPDSYLGRQLLPAPDYGSGPGKGWARFDLILPEAPTQGTFVSELSARFGITASIVSGGIERLGGATAGRFLVDVDLAATGAPSRAEISRVLHERSIVIGAVA